MIKMMTNNDTVMNQVVSDFMFYLKNTKDQSKIARIAIECDRYNEETNKQLLNDFSYTVGFLLQGDSYGKGGK